MQDYQTVLDYARKNYRRMFREPEGNLKYRFIVPGSCYSNCLWDWDSWLTNVALRQFVTEDISEYERGCVLNYLEYCGADGRVPIVILPDSFMPALSSGAETNAHKPCLAQHAAFLSQYGGAEWLRPYFPRLERFLRFYHENCRHETGLYFWLDDYAIGVDNDPCTFYRPRKSSASIFLNCMMYKEIQAFCALGEALGEDVAFWKREAEHLRDAVRAHCYDEKDGFYYSADLALLPIEPGAFLHSGAPRDWSCLIQRLGSWSGFLALWSGIATAEQAERMVRENLLDARAFCAPYGVRTLARYEKMYRVAATNNPSCWLGPVWGVSNYMVFRGLKRYGYEELAAELAEKTLAMLAADIRACGWISCPETDDPLAGARWMVAGTRPGAEVDFTLDFDAPEGTQQAVFDGTAFACWELYCNGVLCRRMNHEWKQDGSSPVRYADLTERVRPGANVLCLRVRADEAGRALAIARFRVRGGGKEHIYESGERWRVAGRPAQPAASDGSAPPMPPRRRGRAPLLRRAFTLDAAARRARLYYCGLGYAACALNGAMVENAVLTTEYSRYDRSVYYNAVDVTGLLRVGENCLAVELGRGYYASGRDWIGQQPAGGEPKLLLLLKIWLEDGRVVSVGSDGRWKCALGPTLDDSPWYGEKYDARLEWPGWDRPGFDDARWSRAMAAPAPGGELRARVTPPVRVAERLAPQAVTRPAPDVFVYDFGKVTAGWARLRAAEPRGTRIQLTYGERLLENGRVDMERRCAVYQLWEPGQVDIYVCRGGGEEESTPKFSYKGFRYVEVQGLDHPIALQGLPLHNDLAQTGCFHCSNELLDRIHGLVVPTMLNNFNSIPTDTPAYEKRGWTGDAQTICETALLNLDAQRFFRKYVRDLLDCQDDTGAIPDTCPGPLYYPPTPEWMCAMTFIPYWLWMRCGDESALRECWEGMRRYADYELERLEDGLSSDLYYGDWNSPAGSRPPEGSVFSATAFVYRVLDVTAEVARFLGKDASAARYARAARKMRENINRRFFDAETLLYHTDVPCGFRQTPTVLALAFGIAPEEKRRDIARALAAAIRARDGGHLSTGCLGLKYLLPVLSEYGEAETAFAIIDRTDFPSWGYWLANGATTCWETWDTDTRSLDHFYFGCVDDWFYGTLAGIRPLEPGYRRFRVKPVPCGDLRFVQARVDTPCGGIDVSWRREDGRFALDVRVPANARAEVCTPGGKRFIAGPGDHHYEETL